MPKPRSTLGGEVSLDSSSFLRDSSVRPDNSFYVSLSPRIEDEGPVLSGKLDLEAKSFTQGVNRFSAEAFSAYIATSPRLMTEHQVTLGRRQYDWSELDRHWKLGIWQPRFLWDPLMPEQLGRTGMFYEYKGSGVRFLLQGSPIALPEQSYPVKQVGTTLGSASPFWNPLPECVNFRDQCLPVSYAIEYPAANKFFLIPNGATSLRVGGDRGGWAQANYAYTPFAGSHIAIQPTILTDPATSFATTVHPTFPYHHLASFEGGVRERRWSFWGSLTRDIPVVEPLSPVWFVRPLSPRTIGAVGGSVEPARGLTFAGSYLRSSVSEITDSMSATLLKRQPLYGYTQALDFGAKWETGARLNYEMGATWDIDFDSTLLSLDISLVPRSVLGPSWSAGIGFDSIITASNRGWIGQFGGDDRVRWRLAYVF